jgi:flagellar secretion chaperone FliS
MTTTAENYRNTHIMTASPMQLVLMLYDECIRALKAAEEAFAGSPPENVEIISRNLLQAQNVITELIVSLDMEKGGEIAGILQRLYDFMTEHLIEANLKKKLKPVQDVLEMMTGLRETWRKVAEKEPRPEPDAPVPPVGVGNIAFSG